MDAQIGISLKDRDRCEDGLDLLDEVADLFSTRPASVAMSHLVPGLRALRERLDGGGWTSFRKAWMQHPVARLVHQDPFTSWSYRKPRGYAGDARLLDFIHGAGNVASDISRASALGREIYGFTSQSIVALAVRERRRLLTELVDRIAGERGRDIAVLGLGSGHLREAEQSIALDEGRVARWVALDQDKDSLSHVRKAFSSLPAIKPCQGSVQGLLSNQYELGTFDLVYAAGLYDHLCESAAKRLTEFAFRLLRPRGVLLFSNFARGMPDAGYMETFMDWRPLFRDENEMVELWSGLPARRVASRKLFADTHQAIIYAIVEKK